MEPFGSKKILLNCKEATKLVVIKEFEKLSFKQLVALRFHMMLCKVCALFEKQSSELNIALKKNEQEKTFVLSLEKKEEINHLLNELKK